MIPKFYLIMLNFDIKCLTVQPFQKENKMLVTLSHVAVM